MADAVETIDIKRNKQSIQDAIDGWLADSGTPSSYDRTYTVKRGENKLVLVIEYTSP